MSGSGRILHHNGINILRLILLRINAHWSVYQASAVYRCRSLKGFETGIAFLMVRVICVMNEHLVFPVFPNSTM